MADSQLALLRAAWLATMAGPPIENGGVVFRGGEVIASGAFARLRADFANAPVRDFGDAVILPGLVNAHVHLELSHLIRPTSPGAFIDWLLSVLGSPADPATTAAAVEAGVRQCLGFGVTTVGDISRQCALVRDVLCRSALRAVSFGEVVGMARRRHILPERLSAAVDDQAATPRVQPGIAPHAPYSVDADGYRQCLAAARRLGLPLTTHLAESPDESAFLSDHAGPFRELWKRLGAWDDSVERFRGGPIRYAASLGLLEDGAASLAHVNYCDDEELKSLARGRASVIYCPRTHAYFGHPPHRWRDMLAAGVNVCVGTDSCASSPDLNLVDDLRLLHRAAPDVPPLTLWEMVTTRATRALGLDSNVATLTTGAPADCVIFPAASGDPLREVLAENCLPLEVWVNGEPSTRRPRG